MKHLLTLAVTLGLFMSTSAHALLGFSVGAHLGYMDFDDSDTDASVVGGVNLGYQVLDLTAVAFDLDLEIQKSLTDFGRDAGPDFSYESKGLYLTAKTIGPVYAIGRLGIIDADIEGGAIQTSDDGNVVTIGVGFSLGTQLELTLANISYDDAADAQQLNLRIGF